MTIRANMYLLPSVTMTPINNIQAFVRKNKTPSPCRVFWGFMYTIYFVMGWVSFYSTSDYMAGLIDKSMITTKLSIHAVLGLVVYGLLIISVLPVVYLIHQATKEKIENAKRVWGTKVVFAIYKWLVAVTFLIPVACMSIFLDNLWTYIGIAGSVHCLFIWYVNPDDYGISDGFFALVSVVIINLDGMKILKFALGFIMWLLVVHDSMASTKTDNNPPSVKLQLEGGDDLC